MFVEICLLFCDTLTSNNFLCGVMSGDLSFIFYHPIIWKTVKYTVQPRGKTQNVWYHQGQNQQFVDRRGDSTRTMIVDKFYHFHHHCGITLNADSSWCHAQWTTTFLYNVLYKHTCTKYLDRIKFTLKNQCKCGHSLKW